MRCSFRTRCCRSSRGRPTCRRRSSRSPPNRAARAVRSPRAGAALRGRAGVPDLHRADVGRRPADAVAAGCRVQGRGHGARPGRPLRELLVIDDVAAVGGAVPRCDGPGQIGVQFGAARAARLERARGRHAEPGGQAGGRVHQRARRPVQPIAEILAVAWMVQQLQLSLGRFRTMEVMCEMTLSIAAEINSALQTVIGDCDLIGRELSGRTAAARSRRRSSGSRSALRSCSSGCARPRTERMQDVAPRRCAAGSRRARAPTEAKCRAT